MKKLSNYTDLVNSGQHLTFEQVFKAGELMLTSDDWSEIADFLLALQSKKETIEEAMGILGAFRNSSREFYAQNDSGIRCWDICGTGGDGSRTFNITTAVAFVLAAQSHPVVKNSGSSISSPTGSADVLSALGINVCKTTEEAIKSVKTFKLAFVSPSNHYSLPESLKIARKIVGTPTICNLIAPFLNPLRIECRMLGVSTPHYYKLAQEIMYELDIPHSSVVIGVEKPVDEVTLCGTTKIATVVGGYPELGYEDEVGADSFGLPECKLTDLEAGKTHEDNAQIILDVLSGKDRGPRRDVVLANTAVAWRLAGSSRGLRLGVELAKPVIDSGKALRLLQSMQHSS
jgi:anthranilate phosphoribosyltransferase